MRPLIWHRRSVFVVLAILMPACLLTSSFDGLRGGARDGGGGLSDSIATEDGNVIGAPDGAVDSGLDSGADSHLIQGSGCDGSTSLFCSDFDDPSGVAMGWTTFERSSGDGGQDPTTYLSAPFSFAAVTAPATSAESVVRLHRSLPATSKVHLTFGVRLDTVPPDNSRGEIVDVRFQASSIDYHFYVTVRSSADVLTEYTNPPQSGPAVVDHPMSVGVPRGQWTALSLDLDLVAATAVLHVGQQVSTSVNVTPPYTSGTVLLRVGLGADPPAAAYAAHYDDVKLDEN